MKTLKKNASLHKKIILTSLILLLFLCIGGALFFFLSSQEEKKHALEKQQDFSRMETESCSGIFLSMYPIDGYSEADFSSFRGLDILKCSYEAGSLTDISEYLGKILSTENNITNIYLGIDPLEVWESCHRSLSVWSENLESGLLQFAALHPEIQFEILFSYPSLKSRAETSDSDFDLWLTTCRSFLESVSLYSNFTCYFPGSQNWLIANPGNYTENGGINRTAANKLFLFTFCDRAFQITPDNADILFSSLRSMREKEQNTPAEYADLSDYSIVFFGDSVIGNYEGSLSVPGVTAALSGAQTYNLATGGTSASVQPEHTMNFIKATELFLKASPRDVPAENSAFRASLEQYLSDYDAEKKLCFVINYGLNDYFSGYPVEYTAEFHLSESHSAEKTDALYNPSSYCGALRTGIRSLQEAYPDALIVLAAPNYITYFSNGTDLGSEKGGVLTDYVDAALKVADEMQIPCLNTYLALGYDAANAADYLADGTHLNEEGRFLFGEILIQFIKDVISPNQR